MANSTRPRSAAAVLMILVGGLALTSPAVPQTPETQAAAAGRGPQRIIVKLRPEAASWADAGRQAGAAGTGSAGREASAFLQRHRGRRLAPVYPGRLGARRPGMTDRDLARRSRARFAARSARSERATEPPDLSTTYVMELDGGGGPGDVAAALDALRADPAVAYAEEDRVVAVSLVPNDPYFGSIGSWFQGYDDLWGLKKMQAALAWDQTAGQGITVAVVDTGIDYTHPDIADNIWVNPAEIPGNLVDDDGNGFVDDVRGWDFVGATYQTPRPDADPKDGHGHGTHVAGTIAAAGNNGIGVIGVAWQARVMAVKGLDNQGVGLDSVLASAIVYAADNGADVINNSWGGPGDSQVIADAVEYAYSLGVVVVAAAGNNDDDARKYHPAGLGQVITVGATTVTDARAYFSNWGSRIDVGAPGMDILSLRASGTTMGTPVGTGYTRADGTSMASPHVAGLAALVLAVHPEYSNEQVRQVIRASARDVGATGVDLDFGHGRIDGAAAVSLASVLEAKILDPADGTLVSGPTTLSGVARGSGFARYRLEYAAGRSSSAWTLLQESTSPADGGAVGAFDPSGLPDGVYTLRLLAFDQAGRVFSDRIELVVDYVSITSPAPPRVPVTATTMKQGVVLSLSGTATGPSFQGFRLEWARGREPLTGWSNTGTSPSNGGAAPVTSGVLGTWDTSVVGQADYYTVRVVVDNAGFVSEARTLVYVDPDLLTSGWPRRMDLGASAGCGLVPVADAAGNLRLVTQNYNSLFGIPPRFWSFPVDGSSPTTTLLTQAGFLQPAAGDLDGQPGEEAIAMEGSALRVFRQDGTSYRLPANFGHTFYNAEPVLEDLDGDSQPEVVATGAMSSSRTAFLYAWKRDGSQVAPAFPIALADQNSGLNLTHGHRALVADLDGDGSKEILASEGPSTSTFVLRVFRADGTPWAPWPNPVFSGSLDKLALADLDRDGTLEIVMLMSPGALKQVHVLEPDGSERPGWPVTLGRTNESYLAVGDIDRNGRDEIVVSNYTALYVLKADGTSYSPSWPWVMSGAGTVGPAILADVDGDGYPEIVATTDTLLGSPNPLLPASRLTAARVQTDGSLASATALDPGTTAFTGLDYYDVKLMALRPDRTVVRSWRLLGTNGNQAISDARLLAGDFDRNGTLDVAAVYSTIQGGGIGGYLVEGVATVLTTGAPYRASDNDWPTLYQDPRNRATRSRTDVAAPAVAVTAPAPGAAITGPVTVSAQATDDVWVAGVQFQLDGADLGTEDTSRPFAVSWDARSASEGDHVLTAIARDGTGRRTTSAPVSVTVVRDTHPPVVSITAPLAGSEVSGTAYVSVDVSDDFGVSSVELYVDGLLRGTSPTAPFTVAWDTMAEADGPHSLVARAYDGALNSAQSATVAVTTRSRAAYDPALRVPICSQVRSGCDSGVLLNGRANIGPEPNAPNTIHGSCTELGGASSDYHKTESNDRLKVRTVDGRKLTAGRLLKIEATVWASTVLFAGDRVDLYYTSDADTPSWTFVGTVAVTASGQQVLSATWPLAAGPLQAVRAHFRFAGSASACGAIGSANDDYDDLAFVVGENALPTADAGGPYAALRNQAVAFDGSASSDPDADPLSYRWDFGDGTSGTGPRPTHIYAAPGTFTATLVVDDGLAASAPATATVTVTNRAPVASAGGPYEGLRNQPVSFDGTGSSDPDGDALSYQWEFGDGTSGTGARPAHAYATPGTFTAQVTVSDGFATSAAAPATVTIVNRPPTANAAGPYTGARGQSIAFEGSSSSDPDGDGLTYAWDFGDGSTGTGVRPTHAYASLGTFTVQLTVSDGFATSAAAGAVVSIVNRPPTADAGGPYIRVRGEPIVFDGSSSSDPDGDALTYEWDFGDGTTGTGVRPAHAYATLGTFTVRLTVSDGLAPSAPATGTATVANRTPVANAGGPYGGVRGEPIAFDGTGSSDPDGDTLTYQWDFGDGATAAGAHPTHAYATLGTFTVRLTVNDGLATSAPGTATVTIANRPPTANAGGPYSGARGQSIAFDGRASSDPDGDALTYRWTFGDGSTGTGSQPAHAYSSLGTFTVTLIVNDGQADSAPATATMTVANRPPVAAGGGPYSGLQQQPVALSGTASSDPDGDPLTYAWTFGDGTTGTGPAPTHAYGSLGTFVVTLVVSDGLASSPPYSTTVTISNQPPTVSLTAPSAGALFTAPATITLLASAADADGSVSQVEFFAGSTRLGVDTTPPYSFNWTGVVEGAYLLTARATDNQGGTTTSSPVSVAVEAHLGPTADAFVRDGSGNTNRNFGSQTTLQVRTGSSGNNRWTYLKFDTGAAATVGSAKLRLFGSLSATTGVIVTTSAFGATSTSWVESQITWNNRPPSGAVALSTVTLDNATVSPRWYEWDLTSYLQQEKAAGRNVVTIVLKNDVASSPFASFEAREASTSRPELVIRP